MTYTISEAREAMRTLASIGVDDWREALTEAADNEDDFEIDGFRFIAEDAIDDIMTEELSSDAYVLGCFNADFLSSFLGCSAAAIKKIQEAEQFEALGEMLLDRDAISGPHGLAAEYARADGYGHHFAHYDGEEHCVKINGRDYYVFRVN